MGQVSRSLAADAMMNVIDSAPYDMAMVAGDMLMVAYAPGMIYNGIRWTAQGARAAAAGIGRIGAATARGGVGVVFHHTNALSKILSSGRLLARTEGRVYATRMESLNSIWSQLRMGVRQSAGGRVNLVGDAAMAFRPHPIQGWYSGLKRLAGQMVSRKVGYDIALGGVSSSGNMITATSASFVRQPMGRYMWSHVRYLGRLVGIDWGIPAGFAGAAAGLAYPEELGKFWNQMAGGE